MMRGTPGATQAPFEAACDAQYDLVLASASPRRAELLGRLGVRYRVCAADIDESMRGDEAPGVVVRRLAVAKALAGRERLPLATRHAVPVVGADTVVVDAQGILGKPRDEADFNAMMNRLGGRWHTVHSACAVVHGARSAVVEVRTCVWMRTSQATERAAYWASGEPADKAGGYALQGLGGRLVLRVDGDPSAVIGLPLAPAQALLRGFGVVCTFG